MEDLNDYMLIVGEQLRRIYKSFTLIKKKPENQVLSVAKPDMQDLICKMNFLSLNKLFHSQLNMYKYFVDSKCKTRRV